MKKSGIIITFALLIMAIIALSVTMIRAWLTDTKTTDNVDMVVGEVEYTFTGSLLAQNTIIVPGQNLVANSFKLTNTSNVGTEIRFSFTATYDSTDIMSYLITDIDANKWFKEGSYYYFRDASVVTVDSGKYIIPATEEGETNLEIDILSLIKLDGSKVGNEWSNRTLKFNITFQAKQSDHVTWADLGSINFETGLNA